MPERPRNGPGPEPDKLPKRLGAWVPKREDKDPRRYKMMHFLDYGTSRATAGEARWYQISPDPLNQSDTSACVGHAARNWQLSYPNPYPRKPGDDEPVASLDQDRWPAVAEYFAAQNFDPWPGGEYPGASPLYEGSSLDGLAKALQSEGKIDGPYVWAEHAQDVINWLRVQGPVIFASLWYRDMFTPDVNGFLSPTGPVEGGHAYFLFGVDQSDTIYGFQSWGDWGLRNQTFFVSNRMSFTVKSGVFKLTRQALEYLFTRGDAEGFAPVKVAPVAPQPEPEPQPVPQREYYPKLPRVAKTSGKVFNRECVVTLRNEDIGHYEPKPGRAS